MSVRLAVIGAGLMGSDHARIFAGELPGATVTAIGDADLRRARALADSLGIKDAVTDAEALITRGDVDAVVITSPDFTHATLSLSCIKAGKKVLCEKPLSQSSAECIAVMNAEQSAGQRFVQLGFMRRYDQSYIEMRYALSSGKIGRALMMHNFHRNVATPAAEFTGAMAITNSAPHEFDIVRHVLGCEYTAISANQPKRSDALVAPVLMTLETADGQIVTVEINNNAAYGYDIRAELVGEAGSIAINPVAYTRTDMNLENTIRYDADWRSRYAEAYRRQNRAFLNFVNAGTFPDLAASAWDGYAAAIVAEAGVKALNEGRKARVTMMAKPGFYA